LLPVSPLVEALMMKQLAILPFESALVLTIVDNLELSQSRGQPYVRHAQHHGRSFSMRLCALPISCLTRYVRLYHIVTTISKVTPFA